jgi:hypothetical protein
MGEIDTSDRPEASIPVSAGRVLEANVREFATFLEDGELEGTSGEALRSKAAEGACHGICLFNADGTRLY